MKRISIIIVLVLALALGTAAVVTAAGDAGTESDPLVTLSYLNGKFKADIIKELETEAAAQSAELAKKVDEKLGTVTETKEPTPADAFFLVTLAKGQTLKCDVGAEVLPRGGSVTLTGAAAADTTSGSELAVDGTAENNHLYVTSAACGFAATSETATLLVRGTYTIE